MQDKYSTQYIDSLWKGGINNLDDDLELMDILQEEVRGEVREDE